MQWRMPLESSQSIEYRPRYGLVLFRRDIVDFALFWAIVRPPGASNLKFQISNFKKLDKITHPVDVPYISTQTSKGTEYLLGSITGNSDDRTWSNAATRRDEILNGVLILYRTQREKILRIRPNLLPSGLTSQLLLMGICQFLLRALLWSLN